MYQAADSKFGYQYYLTVKSFLIKPYNTPLIFDIYL